VDPQTAIALLKPALAQVPNVMAEPAPAVEILTFNLSGALLTVRPVLQKQTLLASVFRHEPADPIRLRMPDSQFPSSTMPCGGPEDIRLAKTAEAGLFLTCTV